MTDWGDVTGLVTSGFAGAALLLGVPAWRAQTRANRADAKARLYSEAVEDVRAWLGVDGRGSRPTHDQPSALDLLSELRDSSGEIAALARHLGALELRQDRHESNPKAHVP